MPAIARTAARVQYGDFFIRRAGPRRHLILLPALDEEGIEHIYVSQHRTPERAAQELHDLREGREL